MARIAFFLDDLLGSIYAASPAAPSTPAANVQDDRPGVAFAHPAGPTGGRFDVGPDNKFLDTDLGTATLTEGSYVEAQQLAAEIRSKLQAIDATFNCYVASSQRFTIERTAGNFSLLWLTGANAANSIGREIGFTTTADQTGSAAYSAHKARHSTHTFVLFDAGAGIAPAAVAAILDGDDDTDYGDVRIYGFTSAIQLTRYVWAASGAISTAFSARPAREENTIQIARPAMAGGTRRWWLLSWRHFDESPRHDIGLVRAFAAVGSATRTVRELRGHRLDDPSEPLGPGNYYPPTLAKGWVLPLDFDAWEDSEWRTVGHAIVRHGRTSALLVAVNWTDIVAGTLLAQDEADRGLLLWAVAEALPEDDYSGQGSAYLSASMTLRQLR